MTQGKLKLQRDEFWTNPYKTRDEFESELMSKDEPALLVDAPDEVRIDVRESAPIVVLRVATIADTARRPFETTAVLVAVDLENNLTYAALAIKPTTRYTAPQERGLAEPPQKGMSGEAFVLDLRDALDIPWQPARYLANLILFDQTSERIRMRLIESEAKYQDPEVVKFQEAERNRPDLPPIFPKPGEFYPKYGKEASSLPLPESVGINLSAPRLLIRTTPEPCILRGSFRLPILRRHIMPKGPGPRTGAGKLLAQLGKDDREPTGVLPITLVATGSQTATPFVWRLVVPTYDPIQPNDASPLVTGYFAVDLQQLGNVKGVEQTLFVYAYSGEAMAGPAPIAFTSRTVPRY